MYGIWKEIVYGMYLGLFTLNKLETRHNIKLDAFPSFATLSNNRVKFITDRLLMFYSIV